MSVEPEDVGQRVRADEVVLPREPAAPALPVEPALPALPVEPVVPAQSSEDTDVEWGDYAEPDDDDRFIRDRPPHWDDV